jgi:hypothetical protein
VIARAAAVLVSLVAPASAGAPPSRSALALTATPAHVTLVGAARQVIRVTNRGTGPLVVDAAAAGLTFGLRGAPRILVRGAAARRAASWLRIRPTPIVLAGGTSAELAVASAPPRAATPGDHTSLVLLTTRAPPGPRVGVRLRIGITVVIHVPGRTRHALVIRSLHERRSSGRHVLQLVVANGGNVVESLRRGAVEVSLAAGGRVLARLRSPARELLPHGTAVVEFSYHGAVRGQVTAHVVLTPRVGPLIRRTFRLVRHE